MTYQVNAPFFLARADRTNWVFNVGDQVADDDPSVQEPWFLQHADRLPDQVQMQTEEAPAPAAQPKGGKAK